MVKERHCFTQLIMIPFGLLDELFMSPLAKRLLQFLYRKIKTLVILNRKNNIENIFNSNMKNQKKQKNIEQKNKLN